MMVRADRTRMAIHSNRAESSGATRRVFGSLPSVSQKTGADRWSVGADAGRQGPPVRGERQRTDRDRVVHHAELLVNLVVPRAVPGDQARDGLRARVEANRFSASRSNVIDVPSTGWSRLGPRSADRLRIVSNPELSRRIRTRSICSVPSPSRPCDRRVDYHQRGPVATPGGRLAGLADIQQVPRLPERGIDVMQGVPPRPDIEREAAPGRRPGRQECVGDRVDDAPVVRPDDRQPDRFELRDRQVATVRAPGDRLVRQREPPHRRALRCGRDATTRRRVSPSRITTSNRLDRSASVTTRPNASARPSGLHPGAVIGHRESSSRTDVFVSARVAQSRYPTVGAAGRLAGRGRLIRTASPAP